MTAMTTQPFLHRARAALLAEPGRFEYDGVVRFTRIGAGYLVFTFVVGFAALNTGNNSLYIALSFMLGALILSGIASKGGLESIAVELVSLDEAWAGRAVGGKLKVTNRSRFWNVRELIVVSPDVSRPVIIPILEKRSSREVDVVFLFKRRGRVTMKHVDLYTRYPFGLFLKKKRARIAGEAIVYPKLLEGEVDPRRFAAVSGDLSSANRAGHGTDVFALREYSRGDPLRQIHWKKSASLGRLVTKLPELEASRIVKVAVDGVKPPHKSAEEFEEMISAAATYLRSAFQYDTEIVLRLPKATIATRGSAGRPMLFEGLALLEPMTRGPFPIYEPGIIIFSLRGAREPKRA